MKFAIVDCGTNTFNLLIAEANKEGWQVIFKNNLPVKLGAGGFEQKEIMPSRFVRGLDALVSHRASIDNYGVNQVFAFATSAVREALNGNEFVQAAARHAKINIEVIDGDREAELIYKGVRQTLDLGESCSLMMDIGGGSTEFIIGNADKIVWKQSFLLGVSRISDLVNGDSNEGRYSHEQLNRLRKMLEVELRPLKEALQQFPCHQLIGSSGSFDTLWALHAYKKKLQPEPALSHEIPMKDFPNIYSWLMGSTYEERLKHPVIPAIRAEYMPLAAYLIKYTMELNSFERLFQSEYALKEGAIQSVIENMEWPEVMENEEPSDYLEE